MNRETLRRLDATALGVAGAAIVPGTIIVKPPVIINTGACTERISIGSCNNGTQYACSACVCPNL